MLRFERRSLYQGVWSKWIYACDGDLGASYAPDRQNGRLAVPRGGPYHAPRVARTSKTIRKCNHMTDVTRNTSGLSFWGLWSFKILKGEVPALRMRRHLEF